MKKYGKKIMVGLVALTAGILTVNAKDVTVKEFLDEVEAKNPTTQDVYIIGDYAFTSKHIVTSQDIMLAARSINVSSIENNLINRTNAGDVYKEMLMQHLNRTKDANGKYSDWSIVNPKIGTVDKKINDKQKLSIHFIDYELVNDVTADVEDQLEANAAELNKPDELQKYGFNSITYENNTLTFDIADINGQLTKYADSGIVKMFKDIVSGNYGFTSITYYSAEKKENITKTAEELKITSDDDIIKLAADVLLGLATKDGGQANTLTYLDVANKSTTAKVVYTDEYGTHEVTYTLKFTYDVEEEKEKDLTKAANTLNSNAITYGFKSISYANKTATFEISDTQKQLAQFAQSGILDMFKQYIAGATRIEYTIGDKKVTIDSIDSDAGVKYAAQLLCLMAKDGNEETCKEVDGSIALAAQLKLGDVAEKEATAHITYQIGSESETIDYTLYFKYDLEEEKNETLTHYADGLNQKISTEEDQSGFSKIEYDSKSHTATFTIKDKTKKLVDFSGKEMIIQMFKTFVTDADKITWSAGSTENQEFKKDNIDQDATVIKLAAELLCAMAGKDGVETCNPTELTLNDVQGKTATATVSYKVGDVTSTQTYTLKFVSDASVTNIIALNTELFNINKKLN